MLQVQVYIHINFQQICTCDCDYTCIKQLRCTATEYLSDTRLSYSPPAE